MRARLCDNKLIWEAFLVENVEEDSVDTSNEPTDEIRRLMDQAVEIGHKVNPRWGNILKTMFSDVEIHTDSAKGRTMSVNNEGRLRINMDFTDELLQQDPTGSLVRTVFFHEGVHILNKTFSRRESMGKQRHPMLWNVATDYVMNHQLNKAGYDMPSDILTPSLNGEVVFDPQKYGVDGFRGEAKVEMDSMSCETLYDEILMQLLQTDGMSEEQAREVVEDDSMSEDDKIGQLGENGREALEELNDQSSKQSENHDGEGISKIEQEANKETREEIKNNPDTKEEFSKLPGGQDELDKMDQQDQTADNKPWMGMPVPASTAEMGEIDELPELEVSECEKHNGWILELMELMDPELGAPGMDWKKGPYGPGKGNAPELMPTVSPDVGMPDIKRVTKGSPKGKPKHFKAIVAIDMSGSVARYKGFFAQGIACMLDYFSKTDTTMDITYCYITDHIANTVQLSSDKSIEENIIEAGKAAANNGLGIDIGPVVRLANELGGDYSTVVMISDGIFVDGMNIFSNLSRQTYNQMPSKPGSPTTPVGPVPRATGGFGHMFWVDDYPEFNNNAPDWPHHSIGTPDAFANSQGKKDGNVGTPTIKAQKPLKEEELKWFVKNMKIAFVQTNDLPAGWGMSDLVKGYAESSAVQVTPTIKNITLPDMVLDYDTPAARKQREKKYLPNGKA